MALTEYIATDQLRVDLPLIGSLVPQVGEPVPLVGGGITLVRNRVTSVGGSVTLVCGMFPTIGSAVAPIARFVSQSQVRLTPGSGLISQIGGRDPRLQLDLPLIDARITQIRRDLPSRDDLLPLGY